MKKIVSIVLIIILFITGCGQSKDEQTYVKLYYINKNEDDVVIVFDKKYPYDSYNLDSAIEAIRSVPESSDYGPMLIGGTKLLSAKNDNGIVDANFSKEYNDLSIDKKLLIKSAVVQALTMVKNVDGVRIYIEGKEEKDKRDNFYNIYTSSSFIVNSDNEKSERQRSDVIFYFLDRNQKKLVKNILTVSYSENDTLEYNTMLELLRGPSTLKEEFLRTIPQDTVIYEAKTSEGICHVKLNKALSNIKSDDELKLAVYSIVNTLCSISGIKAVQIYTDNEAGINRKGTLIYNKPLSKNESEDIVVVPKTN